MPNAIYESMSANQSVRLTGLAGKFEKTRSFSMKARSSFSALVAPAILAASLLCPALQAQAKPASDLNNVLAQLDTASTHFKSATANFRWDNYERVVRDTTTQNGTIYFERSGGSTEMGALVTEPGVPKPKVIQFKDGVAQIFDPGVDQITVIKAGSNQAEWESFLTLGFGGSGKDLARAWNITDMGQEPMQDGSQSVKTEKLDLVSKDAAVKNTFTHVTIWVDPVRGVSLKQIFYAPSGDTRTSYFSNVKLNGKIDKGSFAIKKDAHTTTVNH